MRQFKGKNVEQLWKENARHPQANAPVYSLGYVSTASTHNLLLLLLFKTETTSLIDQCLLKDCSKGVPTQHQHPGSTLIMSHTQSCTVQHKKRLTCSSCSAESKPFALNIATRTSRSLSSSSQRAEGKHCLTAAEIIRGIIGMFWETEEEQ